MPRLGLIAAALAVLFLVVFPTGAPQKLAISASSSASSSPVSSGQAAGSWTIAKNSVAGYRVREQLAFVGAPSDAVGRTSSINGNLTLAQTAAGYTVSTAGFKVDVSTLTSDRSMRDQRIHSIGLQSDRYPSATFKLTSPITLPATAASGQTVNVSAVGDLTIHGSTQSCHDPDAGEAEWLADRGRRVDYVPLQPVWNDTSQYRRLRQRPEQCDDGIPAVFPAGIR